MDGRCRSNRLCEGGEMRWLKSKLQSEVDLRLGSWTRYVSAKPLPEKHHGEFSPTIGLFLDTFNVMAFCFLQIIYVKLYMLFFYLHLCLHSRETGFTCRGSRFIAAGMSWRRSGLLPIRSRSFSNLTGC